jgi:uncharacterized protein (TIGR03435 family)
MKMTTATAVLLLSSIGVFSQLPPQSPSFPAFFAAIQQQLGLRLVATRGPVDAIAVDHAEHPKPN